MSEKPHKRRGCLMRILIGSSVLVLAIALLSVTLPTKPKEQPAVAPPATLQPAATDTATAAPAPGYTPTSEPTRAPTPTAPTSTAPTSTAPTATNLPASTPTPTQTSAPTAIASREPLRSGGLGLPISEWEAKYGPGERTSFGTLYADTWEVPSFGDNVLHIERIYDEPVSIDFATGGTNMLLPQDRTRLQTYSPPGRPETLVDLYHSPSLAEYLGDNSMWSGGEPGQFIVLFKVNPAGTVDRVIVATGNNP